ncbi:hypothetical protein K458DRAFT_348810 [Lentithecium fluviatile CBS 122367]|uniref:Uncharacterized protein n=1 Tax=Lentithecium fluviatile CBS 122367 TaxID=1168545 RepID=A0A6G1IJ95_9PLEO|nr:hypothetical protein K458DRAFT_348810 [Lentithecium fluviatile CBS 122367]
MSSDLHVNVDYGAAPPRSPLPPPPPSPLQRPGPSHTTQAQQTSPLRRIAVQPPIITTALAPPHLGASSASYLHGHTPVSATSLGVPFSPYAPSPSPSSYAASPVSTQGMAMRNVTSVPYNPQQWGRTSASGGQYVPHAANQNQTPVATTRPDVTGMEASMPSPPPPYSPGQNQSMSQNLHSSPHLSNNGFPANPPPPPPPPPPSDYASSPRPVSGFLSRPGSMVMPTSATSVTSNPQFPPPPPQGNKRSLSRDKLSSKFSLSSFRNRNSESSPGPSNIENLRLNTSEALQRAPASPGLVGPRPSQHFLANAYPERRWSPETQSPVRAPTSRRAASTGVLAAESRTPIESPSPQQGQGSWVPPPPPGPPPNSSRSQSLGRGLDSNATRQSVHAPAPPTRRPGQSVLTPIPPTPIGWQDEQTRLRSRSPAVRGLQIDTSPQVIQTPEQHPHAHFADGEDVSISSGPTESTSHSNSTLYRDPARRDQSTRGIRERRSESRAARERAEPNNNPWAQDMEAAGAQPADLVLGSPEGGLSRRGAVNKNTPRSGGGLRSPRSSKLTEEPGSSNSTPRMDSYRKGAAGPTPTPPFSPGTDTFDPHTQKAPMSIPSKALPTPPLRSYGSEHASGLTDGSGSAIRPASQASHIAESRPGTPSSNTARASPIDSFAQAAIDRHRQFIEQEAAAETDHDRLELFADFIVSESRLRRDRYSAAFDAMAGDVVDLTRDLWRSNNATGRRSATPSAKSASVVPSGRRSQASTAGESPDTRLSNSLPTTAASPASSVQNFTPHTEPASPSSATSQRARDPAWNYHPVLSPIPSMAMSTVADEEDSRGRSASRWWEASNDGASSGKGSRRLERSKRESKYMGLPKEARESLQWAGESTPSPGHRAESSSRQAYGANEYPPEKVGLHEETPKKLLQDFFPVSVPSTPDPRKLDVSRLVTLPPPYPRHHPAVNNNHPDLASIRANLRNASDLEEVKTTKERFHTKTDARKEQESAALADRRAELRWNVQENVKNGVMSYADAAKADADFEAREHKHAQDLVQNIFDTFQAEVANPLHAMFCERINKVTASIEHLKGRLCSDAQELNPNQTQEEGDEQPELLEMLTLLKWLFEAREQLHKEMVELEDERNDLYKDIIILPYIQSKNDQKVREATTFFGRDAQDRKVTWEKEILKRYEDLMNVIEQNVTRGVEAQLSAFWDIAPGLLAIVQRVPPQLKGFDILIPPQEYEENLAYHDFPMQYLYSLLAHAGRSAYQFIESQTNLLCLLHEVKTAVMTAGSRLLETQRILEGEDQESVNREMKAIREDEERRLTDDLKEKVGLVESQWGEALGNGLEDCKTRVGHFLAEQGGWDDSLKE